MDFLAQENYNRPSICKVCGGTMIFMGVGEYKCEKCREIEYDDYGKVRLYLEHHRGATTAEISEETGISQRSIRQMLKEDRLEITKDSSSFLKCEKCGVDIRGGRYCSKCSIEMERALPKAQLKPNQFSGFGTDGANGGKKGMKRYL